MQPAADTLVDGFLIPLDFAGQYQPRYTTRLVIVQRLFRPLPTVPPLHVHDCNVGRQIFGRTTLIFTFTLYDF